VDATGQLWVACSKAVISADGQTIDWNRGYVAVLDASGNMLVALTQAGPRSMEQVLCVAAGADGLVYIGAQDAEGGFIAVYDDAGTFQRTIAAGKVDEVADLEVAGDGTLWACNQTDDTVVHLSAAGAELGRFQVPAMPGGLAVLADGSLLVCLWGGDTEVQQVFHVTPAGTVLAKYGTPGGGRGIGQMYYPHDAVQLPDGLVLVSDAENGRFIAFRLDGSVAWTTTRSWYVPGRMTWTSFGTLYVTDGFHNVVRELSYGAVAPAGATLTARFDTPEQQVRAGGTASFQLALHNRGAQ
jgi:DNA-binding beta-propeller fold protein YncE